jgi:hypothetical protein
MTNDEIEEKIRAKLSTYKTKEEKLSYLRDIIMLMEMDNVNLNTEEGQNCASEIDVCMKLMDELDEGINSLNL